MVFLSNHALLNLINSFNIYIDGFNLVKITVCFSQSFIFYLFLNKQHFQLLNFLNILSQKYIFRILVKNWSILNESGSTCIYQSTQCLFIICWILWYCGNHHCFGISTQRVLKDSGQLWITIRYVIFLILSIIRKTINNLSQCTKR